MLFSEENKILEMALKCRRRLQLMWPIFEDEKEVFELFLKVFLGPGHFRQSLDIKKMIVIGL